MPESKWHFRRKLPSDTARDPISSEFFANESVKNVARALVREAIQNSLDARPSERTTPVEIRIALGVGGEAAAAGNGDPFFVDVWPHLAAPRNKLQKAPKKTERCAFLTIEDFGTSGLEGDPEQWMPQDGIQNAFYTFFRAEAYSEKAGDDRGRWGVGKLVFPRSSRGSAFFGYTIPRSTGVPLLMGRMILGHHPADGVEYSPDAFFGVQTTVAGDANFTVPVSNTSELERFRRVFHVSRKNEPGLSVVVPWLVDEKEDLEQFDVHALSRDVAGEYLLPILRGELVVAISRGQSKVVLNAEGLNKADQKWIDSDVATILELGRFAASVAPEKIFRVAHAEQTNGPRFPVEMLPSDDVKMARELLEAGEAVAFDLPIRVYPKNSESRQSQFRVHMLATSSSELEVPVFVRDGIKITNARGPRVSEYATLVTIDDTALASLLGDSENPAHTEWLAETRGFKEKYKYAPSFLKYVKSAPSELFRAVFTGDRAEDPFALAEFFPDLAPPSADSEKGKRKRKKGDDIADPAPPPPPPKPRMYSMRKVKGGFEVRRGAIEGKTPHRVKVRIAYDVRRGNPLRKYEPFDFDVAAPTMDIVSSGLRILACAGNEIVVAPDEPDFVLGVSGFDENRDLFVRVEAWEDSYEY